MTGDRVRASVLVRRPVGDAFRLFTEHIDAWWRRGYRFRGSGAQSGVMHVEPFVGGRLFERVERGGKETILQTGTVTAWEPPTRLVLDWRNLNFGEGEVTRLVVTFEARGEATWVTVDHSGFAALRPDHPSRHGLAPGPFIRMMGLWWGDLLSAFREAGDTAG